MKYPALKKNNPKLFKLLAKEQKRRAEVINLIPSENFVSEAVLEALATPFTDKYAEGKPHMRYYFGNLVVDEIEDHAKELALKIFRLSLKKWGVNVQPYAGSIANLAVYAGLTKTGDKILGMSLDHGGHLTHGHKASMTGQWWNFEHYGVGKDGRIDYAEVARLAKKHKPKIIVCGGSAYSRTIDFKKFSKVAKSIGAWLVADVSHIAGLIAGGAHPSPFPFADIVTTTTHKTLRGPRAAVIYARQELMPAIDKAVFPGLQGGPHENTIFSLAVALEEVLKPKFKSYIRQVIKNSKALAKALVAEGFKIVSGGTDNHLMLVDLSPLGISGKEAGEILESVGIIVNKNAIPFDVRKPWDPSGIRVGTPAVTTQGMKESDMKKIAKLIAGILKKNISLSVSRKEVSALLH